MMMIVLIKNGAGGISPLTKSNARLIRRDGERREKEHNLPIIGDNNNNNNNNNNKVNRCLARYSPRATTTN